MPRQDVPYPGRAVCSLNERIAELEDAVDEKLKTINNVEGNGAGNVTLASNTPAILVNNDAGHNQITLDFDLSQVVTSVNNQTGNVTLDAGDVLGTDDLGNAGTPIYLSGGNAAACTVDASPASGSNNLVTSGGVYAKTKWILYTPASWDDFEAYIQASTKPLVIRIRQVSTWPTDTYCNIIAYYDCNPIINMPVMGIWRLGGSAANPWEWPYCIVGKTLYCTTPGSTTESAYGLESNVAIGNVTIFSVGE